MSNPIRESYEKGLNCSAMAYPALWEGLARHVLFAGKASSEMPLVCSASCRRQIDRVLCSDPTELPAPVALSHAASFRLFVMPPALS